MRMSISKPSLIAASAIAILAFIGGGIAHAASSSATIKVCLTSKNVVRTADSKGKCPKKTKAVAINKVGPVGTPGQPGPAGVRGADGAAGQAGRDATQKLVASSDPASAAFPAYSRVTTPGSYGTKYTVGKVDFTVTTAGFYSLMATSDIDGTDNAQASCSGGGDPTLQTIPEIYVNADDQPLLDGFSKGRPSSSIDKWLETGQHSFKAEFQQAGCLSNDFGGTVTFSNTHMRVYAN